jgi:hypothetical protein
VPKEEAAEARASPAAAIKLANAKPYTMIPVSATGTTSTATAAAAAAAAKEAAAALAAGEIAAAAEKELKAIAKQAVAAADAAKKRAKRLKTAAAESEAEKAKAVAAAAKAAVAEAAAEKLGATEAYRCRYVPWKDVHQPDKKATCTSDNLIDAERRLARILPVLFPTAEQQRVAQLNEQTGKPYTARGDQLNKAGKKETDREKRGLGVGWCWVSEGEKSVKGGVIERIKGRKIRMTFA